MISKTLKISLCIVATCAMSFVSAQERERKKRPNPEKVFEKMDADANGSISLEEFKAHRLKDESKAELLEKRFAKMDADDNGEVDMAEFKKAIAKMKGRKGRKPKHKND